MNYRFSSTSFEQIIFTIFNGVNSTGGGIFRLTAKYCIPLSCSFFAFFYFAFYDKNKSQQLNMISGSSWTTASLV